MASPKIETQMEVAVLDRNGNRNNSEGKPGCVFLGMELDRADNVKRRVLHLPTEEESSLVFKNDLSAVRNDSPSLLSRNFLHRRIQAPNRKQAVTKIASRFVHHDDSDASSDHAGTSNFPVAAAVHKSVILGIRTFNTVDEEQESSPRASCSDSVPCEAAPPRNCLPRQDLLDDLWCRFVLTAPSEDLQSSHRILFLLERAHWFYEDNYVEQNSSLKSLPFKEFVYLMFNNFAPFRPFIADIDEIYRGFISYKLSIPVTGAIILDESREKCLLVKGWKAGATWSFPRGKKSKDEEDHDCAVREVLEETGFDVSRYLDRDGFIEVIYKQQRVRLYIIAGVKEDTVFAPLTKKEISEISWHLLDDLQSAGNYPISRGINGLQLYMVAPFLTALRAWISTHPGPLKCLGRA